MEFTVGQFRDKLEPAISAAADIVKKHAFHAIKAYDKQMGADSGIGDEPFEYMEPELRLRSNTDVQRNYYDIVGNVLNALMATVSCIKRESDNHDLLAELVDYRREEMDYTDYYKLFNENPEGKIDPNKGQKYMLGRFFLDEFVKALGSHALEQAVRNGCKDLMPPENGQYR